MSEEKPFDEDGRIDYHRWLQVNQFVRKMHQMQLIADQQAW